MIWVVFTLIKQAKDPELKAQTLLNSSVLHSNMFILSLLTVGLFIPLNFNAIKLNPLNFNTNRLNPGQAICITFWSIFIF